jgi:hypothetical protein
MIKKRYAEQPAEPEDTLVEETGLPISGEKMRQLLATAFASNYREKFGQNHIEAKNVFSVSTLVSGPGTASYQYRSKLENTAVDGEEEKVFNYAMFRGSAIHDYANQKLVKFYSYEKITIKEEFAHDWKDPNFQTIIMKGHPDLVHYGRLEFAGIVFCEDPNAAILLEIKSLASSEKDPQKLKQYKKTVVKKAKRQGGCYGAMLTNQLGRPHHVYVVTFDDRPDEKVITEEDKKNGFIMINDGTYRLDLDERIIKRGSVYDSSLRVYPLTKDQIWAGYNYCKWSAHEAAKIIEEEQK